MKLVRSWSLTGPGSQFEFACIAAVAVMSLAGCGKVPTWNELSGGQPAAAPTQPAQPSAVVNIPPTQPAVVAPVVAPPDAAQTLAWFKSLPPNHVGDQSLIRLTSISTGLDSITEVDAKGGAVTDAGLVELAKLPALQKLSLDGTGVTDEGMKSLQRVPSLQSLSLSATRISAAGLGPLTTLPALTRVEMMGCSLTQADFAALGKLPALETLVLNRVLELNDAGLDLICEATTLKALHLNECVGLTDKGLSALAKAPGLEELYLNKANITGVGLGAKKGLKTLKVLSVSGAPINLPGAKAINSLKTLESLDISYISTLNDVFFAEFVEGLPNLKSLNIEFSLGIQGRSFVKLKACAGSLETINAPNSGIGDVAIGFLKGHKKLKFIDLSNTPATPAGVQQFKKTVPNCEILYGGVRY